jgi:hypothetical protein
MEFEFLANIRRISKLGLDSIRIRFRRIQISVSEFESEFGELYTLFQNSNSPNIREYEFEFELVEFFPAPVLDVPYSGRRTSISSYFYNGPSATVLR